FGSSSWSAPAPLRPRSSRARESSDDLRVREYYTESVRSSLVCGCVALVLALGCAPSPKQEREDALFVTQGWEADLQARGLVHSDTELQVYLDSLATSIAAHAPGPPLHYRIGVLRDPGLDGIALLNGAIYLKAGLLASVADESQLALLLGNLLSGLSPEGMLSASSERRKTQAAAQLWYALLGPLGTWPARRIVASNEAAERASEDERDAKGMHWLAQAGFASETAPSLFT